MLTLFKSNKASQGSLFSIKFAAKLNKPGEDFKPGGFFVNIVKQVGWNEKTHTGTFSGGDSIAFKLDQFEAAKWLHVIERNWNLGDISNMTKEEMKEYGFYNMHSSNSQTTHINFNPWQRKGAKNQTGFALYVTKTVNGENTNFGAAFSFGEDIILREYIKLGLEHINLAGYAEDKRRFEEGNARNSNNGDRGTSAPSTESKRTTGRSSAPKAAVEEDAAPESQESDEEPLF